MRFHPVEDATAAEWRIDAELPDTPEGREAAALVQSGQRKALSLSSSFALSDKRVSRVREVRSAFVEATALCRQKAVYDQARVELRSRVGESVALTQSRGDGRGRPRSIDSYCVGPPAAIRTAAIARLSHWIARYPADSIASVSHSDQSVSWQKSEMASGILLSGAAALLSPPGDGRAAV